MEAVVLHILLQTEFTVRSNNVELTASDMLEFRYIATSMKSPQLLSSLK
jgi:hypothetical protein